MIVFFILFLKMNKLMPIWRDVSALLSEIEKSIRHFPC